MKPIPPTMRTYLESERQAMIELIFTLARIPAPLKQEERRAVFCKKWLENAGAKGVFLDSAFNVVYPYRCDRYSDMVVFLAHTDTVFPPDTPLDLKVDGNIVSCPGIWDNTANVAILLALAKYVAIHHPEPECGILFVFNSGEEGLGNLHGIRKIMDAYGSRVKSVISLDGSFTEVTGTAVGSMRYRITLEAEGGHSYDNFGNRSAIERLASMICRLYDIPIPAIEGSKTTYNVGIVNGGTSVNAIAQKAEMLYEYRSDSPECLEIMRREFERVMDEIRPTCKKLQVEVLGARPCGNIDPAVENALLERVLEAICLATGLTRPVRSGSTDCNIPLSMGIPAAAFCGCAGGGAHTREEYLDLDSLPAGTEAAATLLMSYFE